MDQVRVGDHRFDDVGVGRVFGDACRSRTANQLDRPQPCLGYQFTKVLLGERLVKIIDLVPLYAIFTKQRRQIPARRSGRFFVNGDFVGHNYLIPTL